MQYCHAVDGSGVPDCDLTGLENSNKRKRKNQVLGTPGFFILYMCIKGDKMLCERGRTLSVFSCLRCLLYIRYIVKTIVMCVKNIANRTSFDKMNLGPTKNMSKQPFLKINEQIIEGEHVSGRQF